MFVIHFVMKTAQVSMNVANANSMDYICNPWVCKDLVMKILKGTFLIWVLLQAGCSSVPVVHVYAKYLSAAQIKQLKMSLTSSGEYRVVTNDFNFPASITENTMIYPIILEDLVVIDDVAELVSSAGHPVENFQAMTKGNHWYTNNTLALFIYPEISEEKTGFYGKTSSESTLSRSVATSTNWN